MTLLAYHIHDCIEACGAFTDAKGVACHTIDFQKNMQWDLAPTFNCWLFTGGIVNRTSSGSGAAAYLMGNN